MGLKVNPPPFPDAAKIKGWANVQADGTNDASYNVTSVVRTGAGQYTVTWDTDFSSADYAAVVTAINDGEMLAQIDSQTAGTTLVEIRDGAGNFTDSEFNLIAIGSQ